MQRWNEKWLNICESGRTLEELIKHWIKKNSIISASLRASLCSSVTNVGNILYAPECIELFSLYLQAHVVLLCHQFSFAHYFLIVLRYAVLSCICISSLPFRIMRVFFIQLCKSQRIESIAVKVILYFDTAPVC